LSPFVHAISLAYYASSKLLSQLQGIVFVLSSFSFIGLHWSDSTMGTYTTW